MKYLVPVEDDYDPPFFRYEGREVDSDILLDHITEDINHLLSRNTLLPSSASHSEPPYRRRKFSKLRDIRAFSKNDEAYREERRLAERRATRLERETWKAITPIGFVAVILGCLDERWEIECGCMEVLGDRRRLVIHPKYAGLGDAPITVTISTRATVFREASEVADYLRDTWRVLYAK